MEYSELVESIAQQDQTKTNRLLKALTPRLIRFLEIHMNAGRQDAEDCAQEALLNSLPVIREGKIRDTERILSFLLTTCRNNYLNLLKHRKDSAYQEFDDLPHNKPRQLLALLSKERRKLLQWCLDHLSEEYRTFIEYWFTHPASGSKAASTHFGLSVSNIWTRKHRVMKKLSECCQKRIEK